MAMSDEHKTALAQGRRESRAVKTYLEGLQSRRPGRPITPESLENRIDSLNQRIEAENDPLKKVDLIQNRIDAESQLANHEDSVDLANLESDFVEVVKSYSERKGISYAAWREVGVPADVLKRGSIPRSRRS